MHKEQFLLEAIRIFSSSFEITEASRRLLIFINESIRADTLVITLLEPDLASHRYHVLATLDHAEWHEKLVPFSEEPIRHPGELDVRHPTIYQYSTETLHPFIQKKLAIPEGNRSAIILPLMLEQRYFGVLSLATFGVNSYQQKHIDLLSPLREPFAMILSNALKHREILRLQRLLEEENQYLQEELHQLTGDTIIGRDEGLKPVIDMVEQVALLTCPVLILGESGVGKEVIANAIHYHSPRRNKPFVKVNCGAIPDTLIDSELFGHEKGAFTNAHEQKRGRFERANGGTIFLDEIGELPLSAQVRLLRVIQQKEIERVGGSEVISLDIRIIAATHRNLNNMVQQQLFREDLFFRINVFPINIPPLRQRKGDIPLLVDHFITKKTRDFGIKMPLRLPAGAMEKLLNYDWRGNVRELENIIERAVICQKGGVLVFDDITLRSDPTEDVYHLSQDEVYSLDEINRRYIKQVLQNSNYKISGPGGAAEALQVKSTTLRAKMKKLGIPFKC